ncbi:MAG: farnesyl-diphosphate farnesyltransferase [Natrialbaceae archaeon]|jgi:farnesyl-diphosphate farnesyltransferase
MTNTPMDELGIRGSNVDLEWCYRIVPEVSRTFALTIERLEEPMSARICLGYLLCRIADTIEDEGELSPEVQSRLLQTYRNVLDPTADAEVDTFQEEVAPYVPENPEPDWEVVANADRVIATFEALPDDTQKAIRPPILDMVDGMAMFVERYADDGGLRIGTVQELEEYCWYVAGLVGTLITNLLVREASSEQADKLRRTATSFGLLLQLVNIAKDVTADFKEESNVYVPATWLDEAGIHSSDVTDVNKAGAVAGVVRRLVARADHYVDDAQTYLEAMPLAKGNTLSAWAMPFLLAIATTRELRKRPEDVVLDGNVKVDKAEVMALLQLFDQENLDPEAIGDLRKEIAEEPLA